MSRMLIPSNGAVGDEVLKINAHLPCFMSHVFSNALMLNRLIYSQLKALHILVMIWMDSWNVITPLDLNSCRISWIKMIPWFIFSNACKGEIILFEKYLTRSLQLQNEFLVYRYYRVLKRGKHFLTLIYFSSIVFITIITLIFSPLICFFPYY